MTSPPATAATRRRQRSVRVSAAVGLVVLAALVVTGAALSGSWLVVTVAAGLGVLLGAAATRITHTELVESRVAAGRDRAEQARAYADLARLRSTEHEQHLAELHGRIAEREQALEELDEALSLSQRRMMASARAQRLATERAESLHAALSQAEQVLAQTGLRVAELEHEVLMLRAELAGVTTAWRAAEHARKHA